MNYRFTTFFTACLWCWHPFVLLRAAPLWVQPSGVTGPTPTPVNHALFDGSSYLRVSSASPSGLSDSSSGTISFFVKFNGPNLTTQYVYSIGNGSNLTFYVIRSATLNRIVISGYDQYGNEDLNIRSTTGVTAEMGWTHVMATWTVGANTSLRNIYINGVADTVIAGAWDTNNDGINYAIPGATRITIGGSPADTPGGLLNGCLAELWFNDTRNNVIGDYYAGGKPVAQGANGELAIGASPVVYYSSAGSGNSWNSNGGTGGALTRVGTLGTDPSPPTF